MQKGLRKILAASQSVLSKHKLSVSAIAVVAVAILGALIIAGRSNKPAQAAPRPPDVEVVRVEQKDVPVYSEWIGTTEGMVNADIKAQVTGYLLKQDYQEGSFVKKGQLLFEIDPRPFQALVNQAKGDLAKSESQVQQAVTQLDQALAQLAQANSQLMQAEANQRKTQLDVNKYRPLLEQKAVTQQDFDNADQANDAARAQVEVAKSQIKAATAGVGTAKSAIIAAKAQVESSQAAVRTSELNLSFTRIISPIDGIAGIAQAQVGNLINSTTSAPLTTVSTVDPIKVFFTLSEQEYLAFNKRNLIEARQGASVAQIQLELILADGTNYPESGSFFFADRQVDQKTGAIRLAGIFPNPGNVLRPGQYGRVRGVTATKPAALLVPQRAVSELQGSYQVAVVGGDNKIEMRTVKVGERSGSMWVIEDGLKDGETVVVEGVQRIKAGTIVNPKPYTGVSDKL
jgi:membrane fusion protein (multidrug efflux system)